jgi:hypothetical protein
MIRKEIEPYKHLFQVDGKQEPRKNSKKKKSPREKYDELIGAPKRDSSRKRKKQWGEKLFV